MCGRSEMVLPNAMGNLQKGERSVAHTLKLQCLFAHLALLSRYANMDFIFAFAVRATQLLMIAISYDIACQWFIHLFSRMQMWPSELRLRTGLHVRPLIPKFHEPAHKDKDHEQYSFNLADGLGLSDGECPERVWSGHNALANSTKMTGPGTLHDIYDDNLGFWNWTKYTTMGQSLHLNGSSFINNTSRSDSAPKIQSGHQRA